MLSTLFFTCGIVFYVGRVMVLANFGRYDTMTQNRPSGYIQIRTPIQSLWVYMWLFEMVWLVIGLFTSQWWAFLLFVILRPLLSFLTHKWYKARLVYYALTTFALLMLIINHFHLHYTPAFLL